MLRRFGPLVVVSATIAVAVPALADDQPSSVDGPASATAVAQPVSPVAVDVVSVSDGGALEPANATRALAAARAAGGSSAIGRSASLGMTRIRRGTTTIQAPPAGWAVPMGTTVLGNDVVSRIMGRDVSAVLKPTTVVMGSLTAGLRGARAGDVITLTSTSGAGVNFTIAKIASDDVVGGTEILMSTGGADRLGLAQPSRVVIWGFRSREAINTSLAAQGLVNTSVRIRRSWDPFDPDLTIGMAETKQRLGEFSYRVSGGSVAIDEGWKAANLPSGVRLLNSAIRITARCHRVVEPALRAALAEVAAAGLGATIDVQNANTYGGCFAARFNRLTPDSSIGFLSRHTWAMALDVNTVGSCQGCAPPDMNCSVVRIFRKHGFAWGGNFIVPDGMHFEWVGERRDRYPYPSRFCRNLAPLDQALGPATEDTVRATMFADDGLFPEG
jgi:hypothetical protein